MPRLGHHPLPRRVLRQMARLLQIHKQTDPKRIARRFGITPQYVHKVWQDTECCEMVPLAEALELLREPHGEAEGSETQRPAGV